MGFPWKKIIGVGTDVAAKTVPFGGLIDNLSDQLLEVDGKTDQDKDKIAAISGEILSLKQLLSERHPKGLLESKRVLAALTNAIAVAIIYFGFSPEAADQLALYISAPIVAYILGETARPSVK